MNDNQRIFIAFFIVLVAALNTYAGDITGAAVKTGATGTSISNTLASAALTYCKDKGDINNDGVFDREDILQAQLMFNRGGQWLRRNYNPVLDVYPARASCGDRQLTQQDLLTLIAMQERKNDEREGQSINNIQRCNNECRVDQVALAPNGFRTCGNTDNDLCREWVSHQCPTGYQPKQKGNNQVICISSRSYQGEGILEEQAPVE
ncbi:MAG: hypothetical protein Q7R96_03640 [Nanoarchaeota archaeon]|nr:hypothetical protein [Nanoarchaeota archaeon]